MAHSRLFLLSQAAGVLADAAFLLGCDKRDADMLAELWADDPGSREFYAARLAEVKRAHAAAVAVAKSLLAEDMPDVADVAAIAEYSARFGRRPMPTGRNLHPDDA